MSATALCGLEGGLICVSISVDPQHLESLLEALAQVPFPVNPQIYHDAAVVYRFADDHEETEATTLVEFPAYESRLDEVRSAVAAFGFDPACMHLSGMLDEIQAERVLDAAPHGATYVGSYRIKHRTAAA